MLASFLLREKLIGEQSFWHAYLEVMNPADLLTTWDATELTQLSDFELECEVENYKN